MCRIGEVWKPDTVPVPTIGPDQANPIEPPMPKAAPLMVNARQRPWFVVGCLDDPQRAEGGEQHTGAGQSEHDHQGDDHGLLFDEDGESVVLTMHSTVPTHMTMRTPSRTRLRPRSRRPLSWVLGKPRQKRRPCVAWSAGPAARACSTSIGGRRRMRPPRFVEQFWSVSWDLRGQGPFDSTVITFRPCTSPTRGAMTARATVFRCRTHWCTASWGGCFTRRSVSAAGWSVRDSGRAGSPRGSAATPLP